MATNRSKRTQPRRAFATKGGGWALPWTAPIGKAKAKPKAKPASFCEPAAPAPRANIERLHIMRAGQQVASNGLKVTLTRADLEATARAYEPSNHEAPLVVGHVESDSPAYGWVKALVAEGDNLFAVTGQLDPGLVALVQAGRYKRISASFYMPDTPHNPTPGVWHLRHVAFLGATPPAVKGLKAPEISWEPIPAPSPAPPKPKYFDWMVNLCN